MTTTINSAGTIAIAVCASKGRRTDMFPKAKVQRKDRFMTQNTKSLTQAVSRSQFLVNCGLKNGFVLRLSMI
jgi:hypothetical protein